MSLIGFKATNHPQQPVDAATDDRRTPPDLLAETLALVGLAVSVPRKGGMT